MCSQMHQPDILMMVKECLSVSREFSFIDFTVIVLLTVNKLHYNGICSDGYDSNLKTNMSFSSSLLPPALFVDLEADFHARVPVVICKEKSRCVHISLFIQYSLRTPGTCTTSDSRPEKDTWEMEMSPQWPRLQSQCRKWNGVPDHVLHVCPVQSGTAPAPASFGPEALGQGTFFFSDSALLVSPSGLS